MGTCVHRAYRSDYCSCRGREWLTLVCKRWDSNSRRSSEILYCCSHFAQDGLLKHRLAAVFVKIHRGAPPGRFGCQDDVRRRATVSCSVSCTLCVRCVYVEMIAGAMVINGFTRRGVIPVDTLRGGAEEERGRSSSRVSERLYACKWHPCRALDVLREFFFPDWCADLQTAWTRVTTMQALCPGPTRAGVLALFSTVARHRVFAAVRCGCRRDLRLEGLPNRTRRAPTRF